MMQTAEPWHRYNFVTHARVRFCHATGRSRLRQRKVSTIRVIKADVLFHQAFQMSFVHNDYVVKQIGRQLPTQRSATPFCHGLRKLVCLGWMPKSFIVSITSSLNCVPRSKIR